MDQQATSLVLEGLSRSDHADLLDYLPAQDMRTVEPQLPAGELGEPATLTVLVILTLAAVTGLCAWAAAKGRSVKLSGSVSLPTGVGGSFSLEIGSGTTPEQVVADLNARGVDVPD